MLEEWKPIDRYGEHYEVSNLGRVRNIKTQKILSPRVIRGGYLQVVLYENKIPRAVLVHRLVAENFIEKSEDKTSVNHIDGDKTNNKLSNLEWVTYSENQQHAYRTGLNNNGYGETSRNHKLTEREVREIRECYIPYDREFGATPLAKKYRVSHQTISEIANNKKWKGVS